MNPYIYVTYAHDDRKESDLFCRGLTRYGFRYSCVNELSDPVRRGELLTGASVLIALTSSAAARVESVSADIRRAMERGMDVLCVSLEGNELDHRFCTGIEGGAVLIPSPSDDTTDRHAAALFIHRLFVRHLTRLTGCFVEERCDENVYGQLIRCAHYAHTGDGDACFELGRAYELGLGVPTLEKEAAIWMERAAELDVIDALIRMGQFRLLGKGIERDAEEAFRLFTRAADLGSIRGVYQRGLCYLGGLGVMKDPVHAIECLHTAAYMQYTPALYDLALLYRDGIGVERDLHTALKYLYTVCSRPLTDEDGTELTAPLTVYGGRPTGRYKCITMRQMRHTRLPVTEKISTGGVRHSKASADKSFGRNTVLRASLPEDRWDVSLATRFAIDETTRRAKKTKKRYEIYEEDWTASHVADAALALGRLLALGKASEGLRPSPTRALVWLRYAARLGSVEALYFLGEAYRRGYGTPTQVKRATELYRLAAINGDEQGAFAYAVCCERGIGIAPNPAMSVEYYGRAAEAGYAPAQNNLGGCYEYGIGVAQNALTAVEWYAAAANAGQPDAQCRLANCYEQGKGVARDMEKALRLYESAAAQGHAYARYRLALCYDRGVNADEDADVLVTEAVAQPHGRGAHAANGRTAAQNAAHVFTSDEDKPAIGTADYARAVSLYRQAADGGIPKASYALYLCHRLERGCSRDEREEIRHLRRAAEGGCLQASYELGLCYMEGLGLPKDQMAALTCFTHAAEQWRIHTERVQRLPYAVKPEALPPDALSMKQAAGGALYMLGYCVLYGVGETRDHRIVDPAEMPSPTRVEAALPLFREAAEQDHVGAIIMLGDLYAYGLLKPKRAGAEEEALRYYLEATRVASAQTGEGEDVYTREILLRDPTHNPIDALMSLAAQATNVAERETDAGNAELARVNAWHSYSESAARGSTDALVEMASYLFHGHGAPQNHAAAAKLLRRAEEMDGGRVRASLWMGDSLRSQWGHKLDPTEADEAYLRGLTFAGVESECSPYTLGLRRSERKKADQRARAEILYRLATLRAVNFSDASNRKESFLYLAEAVLMGHTAAIDDLARIFAYEIKRPRGMTRKANRGQRQTESRFGSKAKLRRRIQETDSAVTRNSRATRIHREWLTDYYTALCPEPIPYSYAMRSTTVSTERPAYVTAPVTDLMRVNALQYLGECFFEGYGLPEDAAAAVTCYRAVLAHAPKGMVPPPASITEATYSLGWCLLYGVGTGEDHQEAIRLLTQASRIHGGACYTLGVCHEEGRGVVIADDREAIRFYRKAQKLGHPKAAEKVAELERRLEDQADGRP